MKNFFKDIVFTYEGAGECKGDFTVGNVHYEAKTNVTNEKPPLSLQRKIPRTILTAIRQLSENTANTEKVIYVNSELKINAETSCPSAGQKFGQVKLSDFIPFENDSESLDAISVDKEFYEGILIYSINTSEKTDNKDLIICIIQLLFEQGEENFIKMWEMMARNEQEQIIRNFQSYISDFFRSEQTEMSLFRLFVYFQKSSSESIGNLSSWDDIMDIEEDLNIIYQNNFMGIPSSSEKISMHLKSEKEKKKKWFNIIMKGEFDE